MSFYRFVYRIQTMGNFRIYLYVSLVLAMSFVLMGSANAQGNKTITLSLHIFYNFILKYKGNACINLELTFYTPHFF